MKQNNTNSFGANLKALRKKAGLTQEELAFRVKVSLMTVRRWEWGDSTPNLDDIKRLAEALHVSEQQLLSPDKEASRWVLTVRIVDDFRKGECDLSKGVKPVSIINTSNEGAAITLGGGYELWTDDNEFNKIIKTLKKLRFTVLQNGRDLGGIKD